MSRWPAPEPESPPSLSPDGKEPKRGRIIWKWTSIGAGGLLLFLGLVGLALPGLQGILFIMMGLALLAPHSRRARRLRDWIHDRFRRPRRESSSPDSREDTERP